VRFITYTFMNSYISGYCLSYVLSSDDWHVANNNGKILCNSEVVCSWLRFVCEVSLQFVKCFGVYYGVRHANMTVSPLEYISLQYEGIFIMIF